jgi:hypothetical protein
MTNPLKNIFLSLLLTSGLAGQAQYVTTGEIEPVKTDGMYKILLPSAVRSFSREDLSDFRIYDGQNREVPYFIIQGNSRVALDAFEQYPILSRQIVPRKSGTYVIDTKSAHNINGLSLTVSNTDVVKEYDLSGSNDLKAWYGISNNAMLDNLDGGDRTAVTKDLSFPMSAYRYLKITFDDSLSLPVNVLQAGNRRREIRENNLQKITPESIEIEHLKEEKVTVVHVVFAYPQVLNRIAFDIKTPKYYRRTVSVYRDATRKVRRKNVSYNEFLCGFELSSQAKNQFDIPQIFVREIEIEIENRDNQPLDISAIHFGQLPAFAIAELTAGEKYTVKSGDPKRHAPDYDIADFNHQNLCKLPQTTVVAIHHDKALMGDAAVKPVWQQKWFLWVCIAIGGLAIAYFALSLVCDMKKAA